MSRLEAGGPEESMMADHRSIIVSDLDRAPGIREIDSPDCHAAFVRDPDGNRLEAATRRPEEQP